MLPTFEAESLINKFYEQIGFYPQANCCALVHVKELIRLGNNKGGFTQNVIDLNFYELVLNKIEKELSPMIL